MRSSKSRSRSKSNRPRSMGNIVNRVFDSSGPEGKVRGTPQQIIEKYTVLARDAQLSNDRVAYENFLQHAEHYTRMLGEAQREMGQQAGDNGRGNGNGNDDQQSAPQHQHNHNHQSQQRDRRDRDDRDDAGSEATTRSPDSEVIDPREGEGSGLVETPEQSRPRNAPQPDSAEAPAPRAEGGKPEGAKEEGAKPEGAKPRRPRGPRKPRVKADAGGSNGSEGGDAPAGADSNSPASAAE